MQLSLLIAYATGNATAFGLDVASGYQFTDRKANESLVTNYELAKYPNPSTYSDFDIHTEHKTYARHLFLGDAFAERKALFVKDHINAMTDSVHG